MFERFFGNKPDTNEGLEGVEEIPTANDETSSLEEGTNQITDEEILEAAASESASEDEDDEMKMAA